MEIESTSDYLRCNNDLDLEPNWDSIMSESKNHLSDVVDSSTKSQSSDKIEPCYYSGLDSNKNKPLDEIEIIVNREERENHCLIRSKRPKSKKGENTLREFFRISKPKKGAKNHAGVEKEPKKEYFRVKLIRGHKRIMRKIIDGVVKPPSTTINKIEKHNDQQLEAWNFLVQHTQQHCSELKQICLTYYGPLTDGKSYRTKKTVELENPNITKAKTFNNSFSSAYFSTTEVLENFQLYIDYLFINQTSQSLKKKFNFFCCKTLNCKQCEIKWKNLHKFTKSTLTASLSTKPDFEMINDEDYQNDSEFFEESE